MQYRVVFFNIFIFSAILKPRGTEYVSQSSKKDTFLEDSATFVCEEA